MNPASATSGRHDAVTNQAAATRDPRVAGPSSALSEAEHTFLERRSGDVDLGRLELHPGMDVLEIGCGTGGLSLRIARAVAPGRVVGIDVDPGVIGLAQRRADEQALTNVEFRYGDTADLSGFKESVDLVFTHAVLMYVADPVNALVQQRQATRLGGRVVALGEGDWGTAVIHPPTGIVADAVASMEAWIAAIGGDARIGRRLLGLFQAAGLRDVMVSDADGEASVTIGALLVEPPWPSLLGAIIDRTRGGLPAVDVADAIRSWVAEPGAMLIWPRVICAWARR